VGVGELVDELEQRGDRLPFEIGAFVALEACEGLLNESVKLEPDDVRVTLEGSVVVADSAASAEPDEAARSLVSVLARLLVAAGPGVPPYLLQLVKDSTTGQTHQGLRDLHDAIEASLIPINRGASRRVLARLVRESDRPPAPEATQVDPHELDAELDELLRDPSLRTPDDPVTERIRIPRGVRDELDGGGDARVSAEAEARTDTGPESLKSFPPPAPDAQLETVPVPPSEPARRGASAPIPDLRSPAAAAIAERPRQIPEPITATIRKWQPQEDDARARASEPASMPASKPARVSAPAQAPAMESIPPQEQPYNRASLPQQPSKRGGGWGIWLVVAALGLGAYALHATGTLDAVLKPAPPPPTASAGGTIDVTVTPTDAQIFLFMGRGPAVAEGATVGVAHEFIVFDEGLVPSRASVRKGATWATTDDGPLYELAVQAQPASAAAGSGESTDLGAPQTEPAESSAGVAGTIRVITNPPGAKVYRFVGVGPTVQIPVSSIHEGQEVLVYRPGHETRRSVIGPSDWEQAAGADSYDATMSVQLPALPSSTATETLED
jgi:hypothetical protein